MNIIKHPIVLSLIWIVLTTLGFSFYIKHDWDRTIQNHEEEFKKYKINAKIFKYQNRRRPAPDIVWQFKYINADTKNAFNKDELKCLQDEKSCSQEKRAVLCEKLQSFPNIKDCKSIDYLKREFIALNQYMDYKLPPAKPKFEPYIRSQNKMLIIFGLIILAPPALLFLFRKRLFPAN